MTNKTKLPVQITLLLLLVILLTALNVVRLITSILWHDALSAYAPFPGPIYIGASGAFWALTGLFLLWSFWRDKSWTRAAWLIASGAYAAWVWLDRLFVQAQMRANWLFTLLVTIVLLAYTVIVILDPHDKTFFGRESYERESQNPPPA